METTPPNSNSNQNSSDRIFPPNSSSFQTNPSSQLDLYTIPTHSCWFSWDSIHETERIELPEFFNNTSFTRSIKIYKEYRDFIISKYREDPNTRLTFTQVRKSLVGDVSVLRKVFNFLDKWGLINFGAPPPPPPSEVVEDDDGVRVRVEEGAPVGVRVLAQPGSLKPLLPPAKSVANGGGGGGGGDGGRCGYEVVAPLASYSDVFRELRCGSCKGKCDSKYYECTKEKCRICSKCFEKGAFGENKTKDDFKLNDTTETNHNEGSMWTEAETLLLLESVLKHGDDWELVAQSVQTKTKHECISRLIELPFGELMLGSREKFLPADTGLNNTGNDSRALNSAGPNQIPSIAASQDRTGPVDANLELKPSGNAGQEHNNSTDSWCEKKTDNDTCNDRKKLHEAQESNLIEDNQGQTNMDNHEQQSLENHHLSILERENGNDLEILEPPSKKIRIDTSDPSRSLMEQVALISTMVGSQITAAAASAAVAVLSDGNPVVRDIFYVDDHAPTTEQKSGNLDMELERAVHSEDSEMKDASHPSEVDKIISVRESIPLALQTRAAVGTALGAAAAHARLLADQEEREIEHLVASIIENQMKKLECKVKVFEDLEHLMEKEHSVLEEAKDSIIVQRMEILHRIIRAGISRSRGYNLSL